MTTQDWIQESRKLLEDAGVGTAELDAQVLVADELNTSRAHVLAHPEHELTIAQQKKLNAQIAKRATHQPLAYIRGKVEFYGREFMVNKKVLVPRPESEAMLELLTQQVDGATTIADIGTGSGAIAISAKLKLPNVRVLATDNDKDCLEVAKQNARKHKVDVEFFEGDLLQPLSTVTRKPSTLLCNLPYVPNNFGINKAALNEPHQAIFGGDDGLDLYRRLFSQIDAMKDKPMFILTESLPPSHQTLAQIAKKHGYKLFETEDFIQVYELS